MSNLSKDTLKLEAFNQDLILARLHARKTLATAFNSAFTALVQSLSEKSLTRLIQLINQLVRDRGFHEAHQQRLPNAFYHDEGHAREMAHDIFYVLNDYYSPFDKLGKLLTALSSAAGACHDIIQGHIKAPPTLGKNEIESATLFCDYLNSAFSALRKEFSLDKRLQEALTHCQPLMPFLADELIVVATNLIFSTGKPIVYYIFDSENTTPSNPAKPMDYLDECLVAISFCDINRSRLKKVIDEKFYLSRLQDEPELNTELTLVFNDLRLIHDEDKEGFLIRLGQDLRMMIELDQYTHYISSYIAPQEIFGDAGIIEYARHHSCSAFVKRCQEKHIDTVLASAFHKSLTSEIQFSRKMNNHDHENFALKKQTQKRDKRMLQIIPHAWAQYIENMEAIHEALK
jgi:hypothetical protein